MDDTTTKTNAPTAWVKLYHHCGALVSIPIETSGIASGSREWADMLFASVDNLVAAGFANDPPRLEEGEQKVVARWLVRRGKANDDGSMTPIVDLYADEDRMVFPILTMYLNTEHDVSACSRATGIDVMSCQEYDGTGKLERNKDPRQAKYFNRMDQPCNVIRKKNPNYNPEEKDVKKKKNQFLFCRWADLPVEAKAEEPSMLPPAMLPTPSATVQAHRQTPPPTTQFGPQYIAMSAQTAGSLMGKFNAVMNVEEQKAIVACITKEITAMLTPEDLQRVRQAHSACTHRLQQLAAQPIASS